MRLGVLAWATWLGGCCFAPEVRPSATPASLEIVVPRDVLAGQLDDQPQTLHVRRTPGTLENRGFLIATLCSDEADFVTRWAEAIVVETSIDVWIEPGYRDNPNTPCGEVPEPLRRDLIVAGPGGTSLGADHAAAGRARACRARASDRLALIARLAMVRSAR